MKRSTRRTWHFTRHRVMTVQSMVAQRAQPLLQLLDLYLLPSYKPRQEVLRVPTTEQMSGCTEHKLVSDLRNNLKSHTPIQTSTVILIPILVILFSPPFSANTAISPNRSHLVSQRESKTRLDSAVQVVAEFGTPHLKASLRTQSEAQCTHKRQHTQLQERQGGLVTTCWARLRASGWALLVYKVPFSLASGFLSPSSCHPKLCMFTKCQPSTSSKLPYIVPEVAQLLMVKAHNQNCEVHSTSPDITVSI